MTTHNSSTESEWENALCETIQSSPDGPYIAFQLYINEQRIRKSPFGLEFCRSCNYNLHTPRKQYYCLDSTNFKYNGTNMNDEYVYKETMSGQPTRIMK